MQINWFTVVAQAINFLVLVWLLKRFLYKPILDAIDAREQRITEQLQEATGKQTAAEAEKAEYTQKNRELEQARTTLLANARTAAETERQQLLEQAHVEATDLQNRLAAALNEQEQASTKLRQQQNRQQVLDLTRKALSDLASTGLEDQIVQVFVSRLQGLTATEQATFRNAWQRAAQPVRVSSAFALTLAQQTAIEQAVRSLGAADLTFVYQVDPTLLGGLEISINGYRLAWHLAAYIDDFEKTLATQTDQ